LGPQLTTIRSLVKYAALRHPEHAAVIQRVLGRATPAPLRTYASLYSTWVQRLGESDEGDVTGDEGRRERQFVAVEMPDVRPLEHRDARVLAKLRMKLAVADVERDDAARPRLEQRIREASGGRTHVEAIFVGNVHLQHVEGVGKLLTAARDKARRLGHLQLGVVLDGRPGLRVAGYAPSEHERLRLGAALGQAALHQENV
jgi:hypothetical protein